MPARVSGSHAHQSFDVSAAGRTLNYGGALTPGSLLEVTVTTYNLGITVTVSDNVNGLYTDSGAGYAVNGNNRVSKWYFPNNGSSGTPTVTVLPSASAYVSISIDEYTGLETSLPVRTTGTNTGSGSDASTGVIAGVSGDIVTFGGVYESGVYTINHFTQIAAIAPGAFAQSLLSSYDPAGGSDNEVYESTAFTNWAAIGVAYVEQPALVVGGLPHPSRLVIKRASSRMRRAA